MKEEVLAKARELLKTNEYLFEIACEMAERQIEEYTEYTEEQLREMCWEGNCDRDCKYCKTCCRNGCEKCEE